MATAFYLWSSSSTASASSTSPELMTVDPHHQIPLLDGETMPKPAPAKVKRSSGGGGSSKAKRIPRRGLGVAQLERLRFQEKLKKIHDAEQAREIQPYQIPPLYNLPSSASYASTVARYPSGAWVESSPPDAGFCYLPHCRLPPGPLVGFGSRSLLQEQYALDRHRIQAANEVKTTVFAELPSNQRMVSTMPSSCFTKHCEFCATKKLLTGSENLGIIGGGGGGYEMTGYNSSSEDQKVNVGEMPAARRTEVREYEFFPQYRSSDGGGGGGDSEFAEQTAGDYSTSFIDLSLSL